MLWHAESVEGDQQLTFEFAAFNMERLAEAVEAGYDIVCSCPTCGYMLKNVVSEGARYSADHREAVGPGEDVADKERAVADRRLGRESLGIPSWRDSTRMKAILRP